MRGIKQSDNLKSRLDDLGEPDKGREPVRGPIVKKYKRKTPRPDTSGRVEHVTGEVLKPGEYPDNVEAIIRNAVQDYCDQFQIESMQVASQSQWGACCIYIGKNVFQKYGLIRDVDKETRGNPVYDPARAARYVELWAYICGSYGKVPIIDDFQRFIGVGFNWLYHGDEAPEVTRGKQEILKCLHKIQESGVASNVAAGMKNALGPIAFLNHYYGWTQSREIIHTSGRGVSATQLPDLRDNPQGLPDNSGTGNLHNP